MRKLIVVAIVSLDGRMEGPGRDVLAMPMDHAFDSHNLERLRGTDVLLFGRETFEGFVGFWPAMTDPAHAAEVLPGEPEQQRVHVEIARINAEVRKIVFSDSLRPEETEPWQSSTQVVARKAAHETVAELKREGGGDITVFGSFTVWNNLLEAGLVDEVHVMVGPVLLGAGTPAFQVSETVRLRLLGVRTWADSGNVVLRYATEPPVEPRRTGQ